MSKNIAILGCKFVTHTTGLLSRKQKPCIPHQEFGLYMYTYGTWWGFDRKIESLAHAEEIMRDHGIEAVFTSSEEANAYLDVAQS